MKEDTHVSFLEEQAREAHEDLHKSQQMAGRLKLELELLKAAVQRALNEAPYIVEPSGFRAALHVLDNLIHGRDRNA